VPEWFQPIDARRRDIVNQKCAAQGLPKLPDVKPKSAGKAYVASPLDSTAGVPASEYRVVAMIGRTGLMHAGVFDHVSDPVHLPFPEIPSQLGEGAGAPKPVESRLEFISSTHRFLCRTHHTICELAVTHTTGSYSPLRAKVRTFVGSLRDARRLVEQEPVDKRSLGDA
jgi:hypothetical protein